MSPEKRLLLTLENERWHYAKSKPPAGVRAAVSAIYGRTGSANRYPPDAGRRTFPKSLSRATIAAMTHPELVLQMAQYLDAAGIPFMVAGSVCSSRYGACRAPRMMLRHQSLKRRSRKSEHFFSLLGDRYLFQPRHGTRRIGIWVDVQHHRLFQWRESRLGSSSQVSPFRHRAIPTTNTSFVEGTATCQWLRPKM